MIRIDFGFPFRGANDFRYDKQLGGGALLDCGGYTVKLASIFLGDSAKVTASRLNYKNGFDVDIYGSATLENKEGLTAQASFGMDNGYRCSLEIWGSKGTIYTNRILTAPAGFKPTVTVKTAESEQSFELAPDDTFAKSISEFAKNIFNKQTRIKKYAEILKQGELIEQIK